MTVLSTYTNRQRNLSFFVKTFFFVIFKKKKLTKIFFLILLTTFLLFNYFLNFGGKKFIKKGKKINFKNKFHSFFLTTIFFNLN